MVFDVIANHAIKVLVLPDSTDVLAIPSNALGGERLPRMQDCFQRENGMRLDKDMHMVIHYDIGMERISLVVKMAKAGNDEVALPSERSVSPSLRRHVTK
ncbi:MAG: hypothetical protein WDN69_22400 [Aliidongia sp.]